MKKEEVLEQALEILIDRGKQYNTQASTTEMHEMIAGGWSIIFRYGIDAHSVALAMVWLKILRAATNPGHKDSYIDMASYAGIAAEAAYAVSGPTLEELRAALTGEGK